ncbi:hypothetical protein DSL72_005069 [Monilinia vaccinii-corymbosi]|uniref:Uncharacterized protein n=1 Tax=Monilinia vaccinii-corymbosi TaxID=61207 RepID=A0A8A3PEM9_9HELO|nr:hypothetical protein DSL72_005069 [Monilinia vaccinii-corymbosi]
MRPISMKIVLVLGFASFTVAAPRGTHDRIFNIFTRAHDDAQPCRASLSCALMSTRRMPDGIHETNEFPLKAKSHALLVPGRRKIEPAMFSLSQSRTRASPMGKPEWRCWWGV